MTTNTGYGQLTNCDMKNRASSHLFIIILVAILEVAGYWGVHRGALLRGYETSIIGAVRDLLMFVPLCILVIWLARIMRYGGDLALVTGAAMLFSGGMLIQCRVENDPGYHTRKKNEKRQGKNGTVMT